MAYKALIFGVDDMFGQLQPLYNQAVQRGTLEIVAHAIIEPNGIRLVTPDGKRGRVDNLHDVQLAIISSRNDFYRRMKFLESQGFPRNRIIDGRVFEIPNLDFTRLLAEGIAYGVIEKISWQTPCIYPKIYRTKNGILSLSFGIKSYITGGKFESGGFVSVGNFSCLSWDILLNLLPSTDHNYHNVGIYAFSHTDWSIPQEFFLPQGTCKILIGNDVWIGHGCILKCNNSNKPLVIGDGAVIASESVVVKNVPPYAIVGGNPAKIIKYRFSEDVIESLLRIKWWDWSLDKIHDNFKYFNDIEKFIALHDET